MQSIDEEDNLVNADRMDVPGNEIYYLVIEKMMTYLLQIYVKKN